MHRVPNKTDMFRVTSLEDELDVYEDDDQVAVVSEQKEIQEIKSEVKYSASTSGTNEYGDKRPQNTNLKNLSERLVDATEDLVDQGMSSRSLLNMIEYTKKLTRRIEAKQSMIDCTLKCNSSDMLIREDEAVGENNEEAQMLKSFEDITQSGAQQDRDEPRVKTDDVQKDQEPNEPTVINGSDQLVGAKLIEESNPPDADDEALGKTTTVGISKGELKETFDDPTEIEARLEIISEPLNEPSADNPESPVNATLHPIATNDIKQKDPSRDEAKQTSPAEEDYYYLVRHEFQLDELEPSMKESKPIANIESKLSTVVPEVTKVIEEKLELQPQTTSDQLQMTSDSDQPQTIPDQSETSFNDPLVEASESNSDKAGQKVDTVGRLCKTKTHRIDITDSLFDETCVCDLRMTQMLLERLDAAQIADVLKQEPTNANPTESSPQPLTQFDSVQLEMVKDVLSGEQTSALNDNGEHVNKGADIEAIKDYDDVINYLAERENQKQNDKILLDDEDEALTAAARDVNAKEVHQDQGEDKMENEPRTVSLPTPPNELVVSNNSNGTKLKDLEEPLLETIRQQAGGSVNTEIPLPTDLATKDLSRLAGPIRSSFDGDCVCKDSSMLMCQHNDEILGFESDGHSQKPSVCNSWPRLEDEDGFLKLSDIPQIDMSNVTMTSSAWIDENASFVVTQEPSVHIRAPLGFRAQPQQVETASSLGVASIASQAQPVEIKDSKMRRCKCFMKKVSKIFKTNGK